MNSTRSLPALLLLTSVACGGARAGSGRPRYTADLSKRGGVQGTAPMVAKPIARKLFIVLDPQKVADSFAINDSPNAIAGFRAYLGSSLQKTIAPYFQSVEVVGPDFAPPATPHVIADVAVDSIEARNHVTGALTYVILHQQWRFAIRPSEADEYLFSFAGVATSEPSYRTLDEGCEQMVKAALHGLLEGWTEKAVYATLRGLKGYARASEAAGIQDI